MTVEDPAPLEQADPQPASTEIASLPPTTPLGEIAVNPRTGEPRRSGLIRVATIACWLAAATATAALLWGYWTAVTDFSGSTWLTRQFPHPELLTQVLLILGLTVGTLLVAVSNVITGYYAWFGYAWTRYGGIASAVIALLVLLLNPLGWAAIPLALLGSALLWTPPAKRFFSAWQAHRHPLTTWAPPTQDVAYGPLPRYRRD